MFVFVKPWGLTATPDKATNTTLLACVPGSWMACSCSSIPSILSGTYDPMMQGVQAAAGCGLAGNLSQFHTKVNAAVASQGL